MGYAEYISFVYKGEKKTSELQYATEHTKDYYESAPGELERELENFYRSMAFPGFGEAAQPSKIISFLDYHLSMYSGEPVDFIYMVKDIKWAFRGNDFKGFWLNNETLVEIINEWVDGAKKSTELRRREKEGGDKRLIVNISKKELKAFFMDRWMVKTKSGDPILSEDQIMAFLSANFSCFKKKGEVAKVKSNAIHPKPLRDAGYEFWRKHASQYDKEVICHLLKDNFSDFDDTTIESLMSNLAPKTTRKKVR